MPGESDELAALRALVEATSHRSGERFFHALVSELPGVTGAHYAFAAEFTKDSLATVRTLAYWKVDRLTENVEFDIAGTPCELVLKGQMCHIVSGVKNRFPDDREAVELAIEGYLGVPVQDEKGNVLGHLAVFDPRPFDPSKGIIVALRWFAARAAAELLALRAQRLLRDSEERYRDLYEEAPNAYVSLATDGRFLEVNRRAVELLGYSRGQLLALSLFDIFAVATPQHALIVEAINTFKRGQDVVGLELEVPRPDRTSRWVSLSIKPMADSSGEIATGRSIWTDITRLILAEADRLRLQEQNVYLQEEIKSEYNFEEIIGRSPTIIRVFDQVRKVAPTETTALILGETGTGKELVARAIHSNSARRDMPLIKVNCAALPAGLVESELFGHERGAFTGAISRRIGRFELADRGTIFLDEVADMPLEAQAKLLRVLQEREFERVGGSSVVKVDVRVIAATNRDVLRAVREGAFREDLYFRLSGFPIRLPPLRERTEDIPLLVQYLAKKFSMRVGKQISSVPPEVIDALSRYAWPGNIRELEGVVERAVVLTSGSVLEVDLQTLVDPQAPPSASTRSPRDPTNLGDVNRTHILKVLTRTNWVIDGPRGAAKILGIHPNTLRSRLKKLGIRREGPEGA